MKTMEWNNPAIAMKALAVIESCNTKEQLQVARKFATQCVKRFEKTDGKFETAHWEAMFQLTITQRLEEVFDNILARTDQIGDEQ